MKDYLIYSYDYRHNCGGVRVLHRLCHCLNEAGYKAYLLLSSTSNPDWNTPVATPEIQQRLIEEGIVVYPEITTNNILGARRVVRYILNQPGLLGGDKVYASEEVLFCSGELLRQFVPSDDRVLTILVIDTNIFNNECSGERAGGLFWLGKGRGLSRIPVTEGLTEITEDWPKTREELAALFKRAEIFYSYDDFTSLTLESRLCGCPAVIIPSGRYSWEDFCEKTVGGVAGLAFWDVNPKIFEDNLRRARMTVNDCFGDYLKFKARVDGQLERFINITQAM